MSRYDHPAWQAYAQRVLDALEADLIADTGKETDQHA